MNHEIKKKNRRNSSVSIRREETTKIRDTIIGEKFSPDVNGAIKRICLRLRGFICENPIKN